jgi:NAD(P)-dependent dehydrogenase (short-subunit alcohol dehydrogenase family)
MTISAHAVITGTASGICLALVRWPLAAGWSVTGIDRQPHPADILDRVHEVGMDLSDPALIASSTLPQ